jgi:hypothetical protein
VNSEVSGTERRMWQIRVFKTLERRTAWIEKNSGRYQIAVLFMNNGFAVE